MNTPPPDLDVGAVRDALGDGWGINTTRLEYAAVGFGSHHWIAEDERGARWFVTVDELDLKPWLGDDSDTSFTNLVQCYGLPRRLAATGVTFVRAPLPNRAGDVIRRLTDRYALSAYPWVEGRTYRWGDFDDDDDRDAVLRRLAHLHAATAAVRDFPLVESFDIPLRGDLDLVLTDPDGAWADGPLSATARDAIDDNAVEIRHALDAYDDLVRNAGEAEFVITHGEPHGANWVFADDGPVLIDWDTPMLAPPERDLARVIGQAVDEAEAYGAMPDRDLLLLYELWWDLKDVTCYVGILRRSHSDNEDTRKMLLGLQRSARFSESFPGLLD